MALAVVVALLWMGPVACSPPGQPPPEKSPEATAPPSIAVDATADVEGAAAPCPSPVKVGDGSQTVALVVSFGTQQHVARCIAFEERELSAFEVLKRSGLEIHSQYHVAYDSHTVCRLGSDEGWSQGCAYPDEAGFCDPEGAFWSFWRPGDGGDWQKSQLGLQAVQLTSGELFAQHWSALPGPPPSCTYDDICSPSAVSSN